MADADLVFYVQLEVKPNRIDEWRRAVDDVIERMSNEDAFVACYLHRDSRDACLFTLYERWREPSVEAFLANQMKPYRMAYDAKLPDLLQRPREAAILKPLGDWHKE
jgi:quinol monooxygenase YgiN